MCRKIVVVIMLCAFLSYLGSCTSMRSITLEQISKEEHPSSVWVTTVEGTQYQIHKPVVRDSKLVGIIDEEGYKEFLLSEVESVAVKKLDRGKTILFCAAGVTGAILLVSALRQLDSGTGSSDPCPS